MGSEWRGKRPTVGSQPLPIERLKLKFDDLSRSLVAFDQDSTLVAAIELSSKNWLVGGLVPGLAREPLKKLPPDADGLLRVLQRWREEAVKAGRPIARICVAYEAGRDGFWLARWLRARGVECSVIHPTSIPVSREHRRAKTDRLDVGLLKRAFLGCPSTNSGARRAQALQHGGGADVRGGGYQAPAPELVEGASAKR